MGKDVSMIHGLVLSLIFVTAFTRDGLSQHSRHSRLDDSTRDHKRRSPSLFSIVYRKGPERGSMSALIVVVHVFSWSPFHLTYVRRGKRRSLISSPSHSSVWFVTFTTSAEAVSVAISCIIVIIETNMIS